MKSVVYSIRDWNKHYEVAQSRKIDGAMSWVAMPCKHDGLGFRKIMRQPDGSAIYGAWVLIVQVAAKCPSRGVLCDANGPLDASDLSLKTGCPEEVFIRALNYISSKEIGWIVVAKWEESPVFLPTQDRTVQDRTQQDRTGQKSAAAAAARQEANGSHAQAADPELRDWLQWWNSLTSSKLVPAGVNEDEPSQGVLKGWNRVRQKSQKGKRLRELLADRDAIEQEIRVSPFCRENWFRLEKLFGGTNRDGELIVEKLLQGGYRERNGRSAGDPRGNLATVQQYLEAHNGDE